jgi:hypothetical protein
MWERPSKIDKSTALSISSNMLHSLVDLIREGLCLPPPVPSSSTTNCVLVYIDGAEYMYEMMEDDLYKVFSRFGTIESISIMEDCMSAIISYTTSVQAEYAIHQLNGRPLVGNQILRVVAWSNNSGSATIPIIRKYTCRFDIQIDNDKEFHVARRIIGQKGANMKRIVKQSGYDAKLRLRGRGSGFLEGAHKQESQEPLHLCVSCKDYNGYKAAIEQVEQLLTEVYDEYREYCCMRNQAFPDGLCLVMHEHPLMFHQPVSGLDVVSPQQFMLAVNSGGGDGESGGLVNISEASRTSGDADVESLIEQRNEARRVCNFKEADRIRDILRTRGIGLMDEPGGRGRGTEVTSWRYWRS